MNTTQYASPQILSGSVVIGLGKTQTVSMDTMASRSHRWFRVDEMSIALAPVPGANADDFDGSVAMGSLVWLRARAYRQDLMLNYVPTWLLGPRVHVVGETLSAASQINAGGLSPKYGRLETYRWKFPKPFFLPPGSAFIAQMQRNLACDTVDVDINVNISVRGAQVSAQEARAAMQKGREGSGNPLPYMAAFNANFVSSLGRQTAKSNNLDLANPFIAPLYLQRMTGRTGPYVSTSGFGTPTTGDTAGCSVRLADTRTVICEFTDLMTIFPATQLAWTHTRVLQPAEYITAELRNFLVTGSTVGSTVERSPQVAIIGYRNEVLS